MKNLKNLFYYIITIVLPFLFNIHMEWYYYLLIIATGFIAGFINTVAGGGSLITLPVLIFLGMPSAMANATNRVGIFFQNVTGIMGFRSKGIGQFSYDLWLGLSALAGAFIGAKIAVDIHDDIFNKILAIVMILVVILIIYHPSSKSVADERTCFKYKTFGIFVFFFIGIYGGFIQAGVGYLMIFALTIINRFSLVKTNSAKLVVTLIYTVAALGVFIWENKIDWTIGLVLSLGNGSGSWIASRMSVNKGDRWIKRFLMVTVIALAISLWFYL